MKRILSLLILLGVGTPTLLRAQRSDLDHVHEDTTAGRVFYEQRLSRNPLVGVLQARKALPPRPDRAYVPLMQGIPVGGYRLAEQGLDFRALTRPERQEYHRRHPINPLTYRFDFRIHPEFIANFGNFRNTVESRTNVYLQSQLYLWRGMVFNYGVLFPLQNDLDGRPNRIQPGPLYVNQFLAFPGHHFLSLSAGTFYSDRYGLNAQYQHMNLDGRWTYGLETSLTGFHYYPRGGIYYEPLRELMLLGNVAYRWYAQDLTVKVSGGQYLAKDRGVRLDMVRQFNAVEIGLFVMKTGNGATLGFNFAVPIPPGKIAQGERVRLRTSEEFRWEYTYTRGYNIGERYRLGYQLDERLRQYHRSYLSNQWRRLRQSD